MMSYFNFIILPSSHILKEKKEELIIKEGSERNKAIIGVATLMETLGKKKMRFGYYDASIVTRLMKNILGGNSMSIGLFCVR